MLELKGCNLGKRHREINEKVLKDVSDNVEFNLVEDLDEHSDVDRLYKIDLASAYNNIDYIVKTLKCGDPFYISRALKCTWVFKSNFSTIINPDYLHHEVFPYMSIKMKKKLLTAVSMHVRDEERSVEFYKYCLTDNILKNIGDKFLIFTSQQHKMEYLSSHNNIDLKKITNIVGNSFTLAEAFIEKEKSQHIDNKLRQMISLNHIVKEFCYLYSVSNEKYLELMEKYKCISTDPILLSVPKLGLRLSKMIIIKHKERILKNVKLYIERLNMSVIAKYSSVDDIKQYAVALLPDSVSDFWSMNFYTRYMMIFNVLPQNEVYTFLKQIFVTKYENQPFEMSRCFYDEKYYRLLPSKEREMWALEHLKLNNELLGPDKNYLWYQFVNYDLALTEIKKLLADCRDKYTRASMIKILVDSAKNERELESLLSYYYDRHVNENDGIKMQIIDKVCDNNNMFKFSETCWNALNKILYSTRLFLSDNYTPDNRYKSYIIVYHIIHDIQIPKVLEDYVTSVRNADYLKCNKKTLYEKLTDKEINHVCETFIGLCANKLMNFDNLTYDTIKDGAREIIDFALRIMETFDKTKDDCPDVILKYVMKDWSYYKDHCFFANRIEEFTESKLLKYLKLDYKLLLKIFPQINSTMRINNLLKKIKAYFPNDLAKDWLSSCESILKKDEYQSPVLNAAIVAIFHLGSDDYKRSFISKYVPEESKISYDKVDRKMLAIQEGICRFALYSRPPILEDILPYIKGDYLHYCLPMFSSYINNLPRPQQVKFVTAILNTPISIQKHGLRLANQCFDFNDLANTFVDVWKSTNSVSLRMIIYKAVFEKIHNVDEKFQSKLYEVLKMMTLDLNVCDDDAVLTLLTRFELLDYKGDFLQNAWVAVQNLPENRRINIDRKLKMLNKINENFRFMDQEFCYSAIIDGFVEMMLTEDCVGFKHQNVNMNYIIRSKWQLVAKYIIHAYYDQTHKVQELIHSILNRCCVMWNLIVEDEYASRNLLFWFLDEVLQFTYEKQSDNIDITILEYILGVLLQVFPINEIYLYYVKWIINIIVKSVIGSNDYNCHQVHENVAQGLATQVHLFLKDLKDKEMLYASLIRSTGSLLLKAVENVACYVTTNSNVDAFVTVLCGNLIESEVSEVQLLAVCMLPFKRPELNGDTWLEVVGKIVNGENNELKVIYNTGML